MTIETCRRLAVAALLWPSLAFAEAQPEAPNEGASCRKEVRALCPGVAPGEGRLAACLRRAAPELSPECRQKLRRAARRHKGKRQGGPPRAAGKPVDSAED